MIVGVDRKDLVVGGDGRVDVSGFLQFEGSVIGVGQRVFVDLVFMPAFKPGQKPLQPLFQFRMNSPLRARQSVAEISLRWT